LLCTQCNKEYFWFWRGSVYMIDSVLLVLKCKLHWSNSSRKVLKPGWSFLHRVCILPRRTVGYWTHIWSAINRCRYCCQI
jgi:hypothetical protein